MPRFPVALVLAVLCLSGCLDTTQITLDITTDIPCDQLNGVMITTALQGHAEAAEPGTVTKSCTQEGKVGVIGTYVILNSSKDNTPVTASVIVAGAMGQDLDVATGCTSANHYQGCAVARRQISFVKHHSLKVPIELTAVCQNVACDKDTTCRAGVCVDSVVETCDENGVCTDLRTSANAGLPCFNDDTSAVLLCKGDKPWCTRNEQNMRACASEPAPTGISFQCRVASDCGPGLICVEGSGSVLAKCEVAPSSQVPPSLKSVTITDPSPSNHETLSLAYEGLAGTVSQYCILENSAVATRCTWVPASEPPAQYTPKTDGLDGGKLQLSVLLKNRAEDLSSPAISNEIIYDRAPPVWWRG